MKLAFENLVSPTFGYFMRCPFCNSDNTQVKDSRPAEDNTVIRRRRTCMNCNERFTTHERVQLQDLFVVKSDGRKQPFDRDKLKRSIIIAGRKRQLNDDLINEALSALIRQMETSGETDFSSQFIGARVLEMLAKIDSVAFVRYASVYQDFQHPDDFGELLKNLSTGKSPAKPKG